MDIFRKCIDWQEQGKDYVLVTITETEGSGPGRKGFKLLVSEGGELDGTVGGGALEYNTVETAKEILSGRKQSEYHTFDLAEIGMSCGGRTGLFFEYRPSKKRFVLFGGGHIGRAITPILESLGYHVMIFDSRENVKEFANPDTGRQVIINSYDDISPVKDRVLSAGRCLIFTHGHDGDFDVLKQLLRLSGDFTYIGMIGSKRKVKAVFDRLKKENIGIPDYVYAPVGLGIGGNTPAEIAVAIAAEIIAVHKSVEIPGMRI